MRSKILEKVKSYNEIGKVSKKLRSQNKKIVFVTGCFDLTHFGHSLFFEQAKKYGDVLIVGIGQDSALKKIKGRVIYPEIIRAGSIAAQENVDYVVINKEPLKAPKIDFSVLVSKIKPDYFVLNNDDSAITVKKEIINGLGGKLILVPRDRPKNIPYISTTTTCEKIKKISKEPRGGGSSL